MVPVIPTSRPYQILPLVTRWPANLNAHVRRLSVFLPSSKIRFYKIFNDVFSSNIVGRNASEFKIESFPFFFGSHPLHCVKPFLKNIVWSRFKVMFLPLAQAICNFTIRRFIIPAEGCDHRFEFHAFHFVEEKSFSKLSGTADCARLRIGHICLTYP